MKKILLILFIGILSISVNGQTEEEIKKDFTGPVFEFENDVIDYGDIAANSDGNRTFKFKNIGKSPLIITAVKGSCGCTVPTKPEEPIMPGDSGEIKVKYATNIPVTNGIGGLVVSNLFFRKLPKDLQEILKRTGEEAGKRLIQTARKDNKKSIEILKESGIQFMWNWDEIDQQELFDLRDRAAAHLEETNYIPKHYFDRTRKMLDTFRLQGKRSQSKNLQDKRLEGRVAVKPES